MAIRLSALCIALMPVLGCAAQAESLPDPTRPAVGWDAPTRTDALPSGPQLQAIRTQAGVRSALISGQSVVIGSHVQDALVTRIDEDQVWLRGPSGVQQLKLFPAVEKRSAKTQAQPTLRKRLRKDTE